MPYSKIFILTGNNYVIFNLSFDSWYIFKFGVYSSQKLFIKLFQ